MQQYIGTKNVNATPMTRIEYHKLRGFPVFVSQPDDDDAGYMVEYTDGDVPGTCGYTNWVTKAKFEAAYVKLPDTFGDYAPHQQRVLAEEVALYAKLEALTVFVHINPIFLTLAAHEQELLRKQLEAMETYNEILNQRIDNFQINDAPQHPEKQGK